MPSDDRTDAESAAVTIDASDIEWQLAGQGGWSAADFRGIEAAVADAGVTYVQEGQILAGKYRVEHVLGVGGMGVVVAAHHLELDERVAVKIMLPEMAQQQEAVGRFTREARAAVKIKNEHVARVLDVGSLENGTPFIVMEYLDGCDLSVWLKNSGPLSVEQAVEFLLHTSEAVAEAHALGIVHRDLKPANLFVARRPDGQFSVKVLDFGISKVSDPAMTAGAATKTLALMGSPLYMSPEQMESARSADARSDIWALGVILYELLTGACPFNGETLPELVLQVAAGTPIPLRTKRPDVSDRLEAVLMRCLEKSPDRRYQTVGELVTALVEFAPERARVSATRISGTLISTGSGTAGQFAAPSGLSSRPPAHAETASSFGSTASRKRPRNMAVGLAVLAIAAVGLAGVLLTRRPESERGVGAAASVASTAVLLTSSLATATPSVAPLAQDPPANVIETPPQQLAPPEPEAASRGKVETAAPALKSSPRRPAPSSKAPSAPSPNCNPNFYFDSQGEKHFKPECF